MKYWVAKNKDGTIHLSNVKPIKPSDYYRGTDMYPNANDSVFWIYDEVWGEDKITGNGTYGYAPAVKCEEYLSGNLHLAFEGLDSFGTSFKELLPKNNDEIIRYLDCTIRCYLLGECIGIALEELHNEMG